VSAGLAKRARMVLLAADGVGNREIARLVAASPTTVIAWRERYQALGIAGLRDRDRPGRPRELDHRAIVAETLTTSERMQRTISETSSPVRPRRR